jgi:hypothetical protein
MTAIKRKCTICASPYRRDIDLRLASGDAVTVLAKLFSVAEIELRRHERDHLRNLPVTVRNDPVSIIRDLERAGDEAWAVFELCRMGRENVPDTNGMLRALEAVRDNARTQVAIAKQLMMTGRDGISKAELEALQERIITALKEHPQALKAVEAAFDEVE